MIADFRYYCIQYKDNIFLQMNKALHRYLSGNIMERSAIDVIGDTHFCVL